MVIAYSFDLDLAFDNVAEMGAVIVLVMAIANIGASVPAAPGGIGLFELIARETLVLLPLAAVDRADAGAYVAVVHAVLLIPMIVLGQLFLWTQNVSLGSLSRAGRSFVTDRTAVAGACAGSAAGGRVREGRRRRGRRGRSRRRVRAVQGRSARRGVRARAVPRRAGFDVRRRPALGSNEATTTCSTATPTSSR